LNKLNKKPAFAVNQFSDMTPEEFARTHLGYTPAKKGSHASKKRMATRVTPRSFEIAANSTQVDWRTKGAVSAVKDQGQCGSCWAFSAAEQIETAVFLNSKTLPTLSPQQIVSCDTTDGGCNGGDTPTAYAYVQKNGLEPESAYPYASGNSGASGSCKYKKASATTHISGFTYATTPCDDECTSQDEATFAANVASLGPASICVKADAWQTYSSGVISADACGGSAYTELDHCVQLVGYNLDASTPYWIVRNSWSDTWGEDGYIYVEYGTNACGIADEATFVQI